MERLGLQLAPKPAPPLTGVFAGRIATTAADVADKLDVTLDAFEPTLRFGPCRWQARDATSLPARGDRCLVCFDETSEPWITVWWPFDT